MEKNIQHIELINQYLNKKLSGNESEIFLDRLKTDRDFKNLYEDHIVFLEGLKRQTLKAEVKSAKQYYTKVKWFKYLGIWVVIVVISILAYMFLFSDTTVEPKPIPDNKATIISDSILSKDASEKKEILKDTLSSIKKEEVEETIVSSEKESKKENLNFESLKKAPQIFAIDPKKDTTIICMEGTQLVIKGNSFVDTNNRKVEGKINISVTEYYKLSDMLLANLSTKSDDKQLETGGMLYLEAKSGNTILKLKENTDIELYFPTQNKKDNMQLFLGEWEDDVINWELQPNKAPISNQFDAEIKEIKNELDVKVPFAVIEEPPIFPGCENRDRDLTRKCTSDAINNYIKTNFNESVLQEINEIGRHNVSMQFNINGEGNVVDIQVMASHIKLAQEGIRVLETMPKMKPGIQRGREVSTVYFFRTIPFYVGKSLKINRSLVKLKSRTTSDMEFEDKLKTEEGLTITTQEVSNYVFSTSQLGWINCDRFTNGTNRVKYKLKVKNNDGTKVSMVFKSLNSILPSRYLEGFDFGYVPKDEDVVIVAIKMKEDKLYLDIIDAKTETNPDLEFNFKEVSIQELKDELRKLNKLFE